MLKEKAIIMKKDDFKRTLMRLAHEIIEKNNGIKNLMLLGIRRRGVPLAERLAEFIETIEGVKPPVGELDITLYRDDLSMISPQPLVHKTIIPGTVNEAKIVIVDDVIYTGRTARAALEAIFDLGRPSKVQLAVIIDRGHRELPIKPDFVGKNVPTSSKEVIEVRVTDIDGEDSVFIMEKQ